MKTEKRITITYLYPGSFFPETSSEIVKTLDFPRIVPSDCYGFYFTQTEVAISLDGKEYIGESKQIGKTYVIGESIPVVPAIDCGQDTDILKSNIRNNSSTKTAIKTHLGNWQMESHDVTSISPAYFTFSSPKFYKNIGK